MTNEITAVEPLPIKDTELDDEIEQILGRYIASPLWRGQARNDICAAIAARGFDVYARRTTPRNEGDQ